MTITHMLQTVVGGLPDNGASVQFIHETIVNAQAVKAKKGAPSHTRLTFCTQELTPNDLLGVPRKVGIVLWITSERYNELADKDMP